jgi:hypothetical protein
MQVNTTTAIRQTMLPSRILKQQAALQVAMSPTIVVVVFPMVAWVAVGNSLVHNRKFSEV